MNVRKELIVGIVVSLLVISLSGYYARSYQERTNRIPAANPTLQTAPLDATTPDTIIVLTKVEIAKHNNPSDCWIIVSGSVYNVTNYLILHPDGGKIILPYCGGDATAVYDTKAGKGSHSSTANQDLASLRLGTVNQSVNTPQTAVTPAQGQSRGVQGTDDDYDDD